MKKDLGLILICIILVVSPFVLNAGGAYEGADGQAEEVILEINPDYEPWAKSLWEPPSGEVESFLFAFQAALGAGVIGYFIGKKRGNVDKRNRAI